MSAVGGPDRSSEEQLAGRGEVKRKAAEGTAGGSPLPTPSSPSTIPSPPPISSQYHVTPFSNYQGIPYSVSRETQPSKFMQVIAWICKLFSRCFGRSSPKPELKKVESETLAMIDARAKNQGLIQALRLAMPEVVERPMEITSIPVKATEASTFTNNIPRGMRCHITDGSRDYTQPPFPEEEDQKLWGGRIRKDIQGNILRHKGDDEWLDVILKLTAPDYFMKPLVSDPQFLIQRKIEAYFIEKLGKQEGAKAARQYIVNSKGYPIIDFVIHRNPSPDGPIEGIEYIIRDFSLDLMKSGEVILPKVLTGTFHGMIRPTGRGNFEIGDVRISHVSPFLAYPLEDRVSTPVSTPTSRTVHAVVTPAMQARRAVAPRAISAPSTAPAPRASLSPKERHLDEPRPVQPQRVESSTPQHPVSPTSSSPPRYIRPTLDTYPPKVEFRKPEHIKRQLERNPKEKSEGEVKREEETKIFDSEKDKEKLVRVVDSRSSGVLFIPSSVEEDAGRVLASGERFAVKFETKFVAKTEALKPIESYGTSEAIHDLYRRLKSQLPPEHLAQLEPTPSDTPVWFNNLLFLNKQDNWEEECRSIREALASKEIRTSVIALDPSSVAERNRGALLRDNTISFDFRQGFVVMRSSAIFKVTANESPEKPRYIVRTVEKTFPVSALASGKLTEADLEKAEYIVNSSSMLVSEDEAILELQKRLAPDYQMPAALLKAGEEAYAEQRDLQNQGVAVARRQLPEALQQIHKEKEDRTKYCQDDYLDSFKKALGSREAYAHNFAVDVTRGINFKLIGEPQRKVERSPVDKTNLQITLTRKQRARLERSAAEIASYLKPEEVVPWEKLIQSLISQAPLNGLISQVKVLINQQITFEYDIRIDFSGEFLPIEITINRNAKGEIDSVDFKVSATLDILDRENVVLSPNFFTASIAGRLNIKDGKPNIEGLELRFPPVPPAA